MKSMKGTGSKRRLYLFKLNNTKHKDTMEQGIITETTPKSRRKSGIDLAMEDVAAGRVFQAKDGADLIRQCLED